MGDFGKKEIPSDDAELYEHQYRKKYDTMSLNGMAKRMKSLKAKHESLGGEASKIWHEYDYLRMRAIIKKVEEMGLESPVTIKGVGKIKITPQASCKTLDKEGLMDWFREHDLDDMIQEVINASTLKAFINEQMKKGDEIPGEDLIEFKPYDVASITKA